MPSHVVNEKLLFNCLLILQSYMLCPVWCMSVYIDNIAIGMPLLCGDLWQNGDSCSTINFEENNSQRNCKQIHTVRNCYIN